jgi:glycosyltransferase involved in cell wall biosynthesis
MIGQSDMHIAQIAPPFESVPPTRYGGTERVVATLTDELVRRGHDVTLFASGDSKTRARLVPVVDQALWHHDPPYENFLPFWTMVLDRVAPEVEKFDIVHSHLDHFGYPLARLANRPVVTTLHGRLDLPELEVLHHQVTDVPLVSISDAQRQPAPRANWAATVYHGIPLDTLTLNPRRGAYLAWLGRISPEKGLDTAIEVARRADMPIKIAARKPLANKEDPNVRRDWEYYTSVVEPLLQEGSVELVGQVDEAEKNGFLCGAAALLFPISWPEPFGLVMVEALACGTPVLAFRHGSVPEVLEHGVTGFICDTEDEMVDAVRRIDEIDRSRCRAEVERRFTPAIMADAYERVYERLIREFRPPVADDLVGGREVPPVAAATASREPGATHA